LKRNNKAGQIETLKETNSNNNDTLSANNKANNGDTHKKNADSSVLVEVATSEKFKPVTSLPFRLRSSL
jgi:hypothetical protein